jgi:hypothetical protein
MTKNQNYRQIRHHLLGGFSSPQSDGGRYQPCRLKIKAQVGSHSAEVSSVKMKENEPFSEKALSRG